MTYLHLGVAALPALVSIYTLFSTLRGLSRLPTLRGIGPGERARWPRLTIVSPACNEEKHVASAVASMLAIDYPDFAVVAIDDRSTDRTGAILDALATAHPQLKVHHVTALPDGWLGKLNALREGVARADGEWILFMDADTHLGPSTLKRAIAHCEDQKLDCLSVIPEVAPAGLVADAVFDVSLALLSNQGRLHAVSDPESRHVAATGAFILVRKSRFDQTPGFEWLRLEVADDFGLVMLMKTHGGRCAIINGAGEVALEWYADFGDMTRAMQKNFFAVMSRFSLARAIALAMVSAWFALYGLALLVPAPIAAQALTLLGLLSMTAATAIASSRTGRKPGILWPIGFLAMAFMALRAGIIGWRIGGIQWRGVLYPSALLAPNQKVRV